ncbi:hypothetical protein JW949_04160 [Candidatus Woesearchaeota archaeon]|nr:hypothetical protein [Candidatus Woesearchaeota archaeon]
MAKEKTKSRKQRKKIPKILEERCLINKEHRKILKSMEDLSPKDTGNLYIPGARGREIPSVEMIAEKSGFEINEVKKLMKEVKNVWKISDRLPTNNGWYTKEEALISALTNQHKLRWDEEIKDYRVSRIIAMSAELGTGTLYTREKAFEGEKILRKALGIDEMLNAYIIQGGVMPQIMSFYGKLKKNRARMAGIYKGKGKDQESAEDEARKFKSLIESATKKKINRKMVKTIDEKIIGTINSVPEAARSVPHEAAHLVYNIPSNIPIFFQESYNDRFNKDEIEDILLKRYNLAMKEAEKAEGQLPGLEDKLANVKENIAHYSLDVFMGNYIINYFNGKKSEDIPKGKELREYIKNNIFPEEKEEKIKKSFKKLFLKNFGKEDEFERCYEEALLRYVFSNSISNIDNIKERFIRDEHNKKDNLEKKPTLENRIAEYQKLIETMAVEESERIAWFTKRYALNNSDAKIISYTSKQDYKLNYTDIIFPKLEELVGRKLNLHHISDLDISVYIPDPGQLYGMNEYPNSKLYGTIISLVPSTNIFSANSNEPLQNSLIQLQKKHEGSIAVRIKNNIQKPKKWVNDECKYSTKAFSDLLITSWGAEGLHFMPKLVVAPTRIKGEYRDEIETAVYMKLPTRHDTKKLAILSKKGNVGTWEVKRLHKGGPTTGNAYFIEHADRSKEGIFVDDCVYEEIADKYSEKLKKYEGKLSRAKTRKTKKKWKDKIEDVYKNIKTEYGELYNILMSNDHHFGAYNYPGRPTNVDCTRSTHQVALQTYGLGLIDVVAGTEFLHGILAYGGYDSKMEGKLEDPESFRSNLEALIKGMENKGYPRTKIIETVEKHVNEKMNSKATFRLSEQISMFKTVLKDMFTEMMDNNIPVKIGSGNHWDQSVYGLDEADLLVELFDDKYKKMGLIEAIRADGESYTIDSIKLPSKEGTKINAILGHKMWSGSTEISNLSKQALGNKENATIYLTADRHHPGMVVEKEKLYVLDCGKQTFIPYVLQIGKASSVRGTTVVGYNPNRKPIYSMRFFLDSVVDRVIGWKNKSEILGGTQGIISEELIKVYGKKPEDLYHKRGNGNNNGNNIKTMI